MTVTGNTFIDGSGRNYGDQITVFGFKMQKPVKIDGEEEWVTVQPLETSKTLRNTQFALKPGHYGFHIAVNPVVNRNATVLDVEMTNVSLMGWTTAGTPRLSKDNLIKTKVHIGNNKQAFIIGGLRKREVVRSVTGVPILSRIPFLGYLFSTESESTKRSQLVLVCEAESSSPTTGLPAEISSDVYKAEMKLRKAGDKNKYFFNQWVMDK
jgi:Flp pilus assembly secretin CpaC